MPFDYYAYSRSLNVIDVSRPGNGTGVVTDRRLYTPNPPQVPRWAGAVGMLLHGTVGSNSLAYLAGGSIADGRWVCAHYLIPKDLFTVYKLVPDGYGCNHAGPGRWRGVTNLNECFVGVEIENLQNGQDEFPRSQYIKAAMVWANLSARDSLLDLNLTGHAQVATYADGHLGRRSDPLPAGPFDWCVFYQHLQGIRRDRRISDWWGVPWWNGGRPLSELEL